MSSRLPCWDTAHLVDTAKMNYLFYLHSFTKVQLHCANTGAVLSLSITAFNTVDVLQFALSPAVTAAAVYQQLTEEI